MLKHGNAFSLSIAAACLALLTPGLARAADPIAQTGNTTMNSAVSSPAAQQEAAQMVSAHVHLPKALDARKLQPGHQFEAVMDGTVHLKNGTELPHGTVLIGNVATDQMQSNGTSHLALRFTAAKLKDGKMVPIKAMITGVAAAPDYDGYASNDSVLPAWSRSALQIDEVGALGSVDLHSRIAASNSGVFVTTKDDVKLAAGSQLSLAIAPRSDQNVAGMNGGS